MATTLQTIINNARTLINESSAAFWTDAELLGYAVDGCRDLYKAIIDLHDGHFTIVDESNVSMGANANTLTGVPSDVFRVELIEVRDQTTASTVQNMTFEARKINHPDFSAARSLGAVAPSGVTVFFDVLGAGSPVSAPTIQVAPQITSAVDLRFVYTQTLGTLTVNSNNPIPGESDHAVMAWIIAYALGRERSTGPLTPDPTWLQVYATDKTHILTALTPRQTEDNEYPEALFEVYW